MTDKTIKAIEWPETVKWMPPGNPVINVVYDEVKPMISLKENKNSLLNLPHTIKALEEIDGLIEYYSEPVPGPAYVSFSMHGHDKVHVQFNRAIMIEALKSQRQTFVKYLADLGIQI